VTAVDGSDVAIKQGQKHARAQSQRGTGAHIRWLVADLEPGLPATVQSIGFDLIVMIRYVHLDLLASLCGALNPGGYLLTEQHLQSKIAVGGPGRSAFRVASGALRERTVNLQCLVAEEGLFVDPDGKRMALSRLLARKSPHQPAGQG
jgi:hypothetical protein